MIISKVYLVFFLSMLVVGCSSINKNKIDYIAMNEVNEQYFLPDLSDCDKLDALETGTLRELYVWSINVKRKHEECSQFNNEKKEWILRNFGDKE